MIRRIACKAQVPEIDGPTHRYMQSSPGCWQVYGEVLSREYSDPAYGALHRLTVDTYAVQHAGRPTSQSIRSVSLHLMSLCLVLERGMELASATRALQAAVRTSDSFVWLEPPQSLGQVTVADVCAAASPQEHKAAVRAWAKSAWSGWAVHHDTVHSLLTQVE